nr:hypothetical protein [Morchella crassipes]
MKPKRPPLSTPPTMQWWVGGRQRLKEGGHFNHKMTTLFTPPSLHVMRGVEGGGGGRSSLWPPPPPPSFILIFSPALPYHNLDYENNPCLKGKGDSEKTCLF